MPLVRIQAIDHLDDDVTAAAAIAAGGSAELDILLAAERHAAVAAVAGADKDLCFVKEFHGVQVRQGGCRGNPLCPGYRRKALIFGPF
jgi:hypothetical protein